MEAENEIHISSSVWIRYIDFRHTSRIFRPVFLLRTKVSHQGHREMRGMLWHDSQRQLPALHDVLSEKRRMRMVPNVTEDSQIRDVR